MGQIRLQPCHDRRAILDTKHATIPHNQPPTSITATRKFLIPYGTALLYLKNFRYRSFLLEGDVRCTEQGLGGFLGAFDASDLDEPFGRVVEEPG